MEKFAQTIDHEVQGKADVILLPEGITVVGTGKKDSDMGEPIPGPTTKRLGEVARQKHSYIVAGMFEREGPAIYNTAVLIDRAGNVAGKYRKVYLPREEMEVGLTPGSDFPVFQTDFGKVGLMICWDLQYTDPARALVLGGAELILLPIWGGERRSARLAPWRTTCSWRRPVTTIPPTSWIRWARFFPKRATAAKWRAPPST